MGYGLLAGAITAEIVATISMKYSEGFSKTLPSIVTATGYVIAFALLAQALKTLQVGTAYAIWSGVGTAAVAVIGILFMNEALSVAKVAGVLLIIAGVLVLNMGGAH
ncbi:multidrug efflux SMR transporter [Streptomyces sp. NPDC046712]|uniref:DMT family transporter n=1 Tax=Streptomyces sp. NPDC046712 TaxID=3154802 RepID=UPI0033C038DD